MTTMMKRRFATAGVCLIGVVALGAAATASASASEPSFWQCGAAFKNAERKYTGRYTDKTCSKEATTKEIEEGKTNRYEFEEWNLGSGKEKTGKKGEVKEFKVKSERGVGADFEIAGFGGLVCRTAAASGEFTGPKTVGKTVATFTGCEVLHHKCESEQAGVKEGEIRTNPLKAEIGYLGYVEPHLVGAAFTAEGGYFAEWHCAELFFRISGSVVGEIEIGAMSPYGKFSKELTLRFEQAAGHQECRGHACTSLEGIPGEDVLETELSGWPSQGEWEEPIVTALEDALVLKGEELYLEA